MLAGCWARLSASPRLTARVNSCSAFMKRRPASMPSLSSKAIMPPGCAIWRLASSNCGKVGRPGKWTTATLAMRGEKFGHALRVGAVAIHAQR